MGQATNDNAYQDAKSGRWNFVSFVVATSDRPLLRSLDGAWQGVPIDPVGPLTFAVGLLFFAIGAWQARRLSR